MKNQKAFFKKRKLIALRRLVNMLFLVLICLTILVMGILFWILPKKTVSEAENRSLASFPETSLKTIWSGDFTSGLNVYYSDNFVFRDELVKAKFAIEENRGLRFDDVKIYGDGVSEQTGADQTQKILQSKDDFSKLSLSIRTQNASQIARIDLNNPYYTDPNKHFDFDKDALSDKFSEYLDMNKEELQGEKRGNLFVIGDTALEIFYGNEKVSGDYAAVINAYYDAVGDIATVYDMIIPNHFEFGLPEKYKGEIGKPQRPYMDIVATNLNPAIRFVDIYDTLRDHYAEGEYLYFRTDHHWTGLGAYRAYEVFCEYAGLDPIPLDAYEKRTTTGFLGTLYNSSLDKKLKENPDTVEYYVPDLPYKQTNMNADFSTYGGTLISEYSSGKTNGYLTFMGGDIPLATIRTENTSDRSIIVFKESYGNAFIPFLVPHYSTIYVADIRSFPYNAAEFIREKSIGEVLFVNNIMTSNTSARVANILSLLAK